ncbi:MAG: alpha/beta hydrolase [Gammaproteobacteria bacterium]|nr:alpha/beta hydrolase [Gammaproteobacteria bacterium]
MFLYRRFRTPEEIDAHYNLGAQLANPQQVLDDYASLSAAARAAHQCELDVRYGPTLDERLDVFPAAEPGAPILLFIHGGYWRILSQREFSFVASGMVPHGVTVVLSNYSLCPKVTISEITRQNRAVVAWLRAHARRYNGNPGKIWVMGHSAGAQQTALLLGTNWRREYGLPENVIKGGIAISGVYDLEPLRHSFLQPVLQLDHDLIRRESPIHNLPRKAPPLHLHVGKGEPEEFIRQSRALHRAWRAAGLKSDLFVRPGVDHFSIIRDLARPSSAYCARILSVMERRRNRRD